MPQNSQQPIGGAENNTIYVTDSAGNVNVVNVQTGNYQAIALGGSTIHGTLSQDGKHLYVTQSTVDEDTSSYQGHIKVINTDTNQVEDTIDTGSYVPNIISPTPDGRYLYVSGLDFAQGGLNTDSILVIDTANNNSINEVNVGRYPSMATVSPDGKQVYVAVVHNLGSATQPMSGEVVVLDTTHNNVEVKRTPLASGANAIAFSPDGRYAYVTDLGNKVHVFDTSTNNEIAAITTPRAPQYILTTADGAAAYVLGVNLTSLSAPAAIYKITGSTANTAPTFTLTPSQADSNGAITYTVTNPNDVDGDTVSYRVTQPAHGAVALQGTQYVYTPSGSGQADAFTVYADDGHGGVTAQTVNVAAPNHAPTLATSGSPTTAANGVVTGTVVGHDADAGDTLTYAATTDGTKGAVTINPNGTWTYTPTAAARHSAAATSATAAQRSDTVTITVSDGRGGTDSQTINVDLTPELDPFTATASPVGDNAFGSLIGQSRDGRYLYSIERGTRHQS